MSVPGEFAKPDGTPVKLVSPIPAGSPKPGCIELVGTSVKVGLPILAGSPESAMEAAAAAECKQVTSPKMPYFHDRNLKIFWSKKKGRLVVLQWKSGVGNRGSLLKEII
ncbi:hypothetical protein B9Z55_007853 [Caenorhabditis nigoni]|uniref:Uncharacterized protein n=1 Tax=Caenorhabditis nigoni TaxID=1611254 RepID=A0A2G5VBP9_9PELO|nr:hypothetical protein B9Z55_007853 [Caenorhabditis nigoni]